MLPVTKTKNCGVTQFKRLQEISGNRKHVYNFEVSFFDKCCNLCSRNLSAHYGCVNAVEFSNGRQNLLASGGDDKRVLLWDLGKAFYQPDFKPTTMIGTHISNIFCIAFDINNEKLFSSGNDEQVLVHDVKTKALVDVYIRDDAVYSISSHPNDPNVFITASEDGKLRMTDMRIRSHTGTICLANYVSAFHGVAFNPAEPIFVAGAHSKEGVGLWDTRKPKSILLRYGSPHSPDSAMSVRFNEVGSQLVALQRRNAPVVYQTHDTAPLVKCFSRDYLNSCTMKSGCFAGEKDEYIVSGSDDFNIYVWKIPRQASDKGSGINNNPHIVLQGHRSIVNQVRYNKEMHVLASSGVEKIIQMWSPFHYPDFVGETDKKPLFSPTRPLYSRNEYIHLVLHSGVSLTHDYESETTQEDPRMIAFFDSLLEHDRRNADVSDDEDAMMLPAMMSTIRREGRDTTSSYSSSLTSEDEESSSVLRMWQRLPPNNQTTDSIPEVHSRLLQPQPERKGYDSDEDEIDEAYPRNVECTDVVTVPAIDISKPQTYKAAASLKNSRKKVDSKPRDRGTSKSRKGKGGTNSNSSLPSCSKEPDHVNNRPKNPPYFCHRPKPKKEVIEKYSSSDDSEQNNSTRSKMRKQNAQRKRKSRKKWIVESSSSPTDKAPILSSTPSKKVTTHHSSTAPETSVSSTATEENASLEQQYPNAYERSKVKLNRSIEITDLRFSHIAENIAVAIEEDERAESELAKENDNVEEENNDSNDFNVTIEDR